MTTMKWLCRLLGWRMWLILLLGLIQCGRAGIDVGLALLMRSAIDGAVAGDVSVFIRFVFFMILFVAMQLLLFFSGNVVRQEAWIAAEKVLRDKIYGSLLEQKFDRISAYHTGELMNRLFSDVNTVAETTISLFPSMLYMLCRIAGVVFILYRLAPAFPLLFIAAGVAASLLSYLPRNCMKRLQRRASRAYENVWSFMQESLTNFLTIRTFRCETKIRRVGQELLEEYRKKQRRRGMFQNVLNLSMLIFMEFGYYGGFIYCGLRIAGGTMSYGTLTAVLQLIGQAQSSFADVGSILPRLSAVAVSIERLSDLGDISGRDEQEGLLIRQEDGEAKEMYEHLEAICFERVSFGYEEKADVLRNVSFQIRKGEFVALTGESGSGKSTIMKLLLSVYQPRQGRIFLRGRDGKTSLTDVPRGMFAYVPQGNYLMSGKIWQVVGLVDPVEEISMDRVRESCRIACADEFIEMLPNGYDTKLGERGAGLSEGQMQRIAIARAIYSGYPILLLDEVTSALDSETEERLMASLRRMNSCTVLLVTHRPDTWKACDRTLQIGEDGKLTERSYGS